MAVDIEELIIEPFRELVERGREAIANAEAAENEDAELSKQVLRSAQSLVREGERALKRLQPLWAAQVERHGEAFKDAFRVNGNLHISALAQAHMRITLANWFNRRRI
jgi:hypothetical protein